MMIHTMSVNAKASLCPSRSCAYPKKKAPTAAVMLTNSTKINVCVTVNPITATAYTAAKAMTVAIPH